MRCPSCSAQFADSGSAESVECPTCRKSFHAPVAIKGLKRTCPACEEKFPGELKECPSCGAEYVSAREEKYQDAQGSFAPERAGMRKGVLGGLVMIGVAAVWFFVGLAFDRIFIYPPILAAIGLYAMFKGGMEGNLAGKPGPRRRKRG